MKTCEACGTTKNIYTALGGVMLCKDHYQDISAAIEKLRAKGIQVNVAGMARKIYRKINKTNNYILRDIPSDLWSATKEHAHKKGLSIREVIITALAETVM